MIAYDLKGRLREFSEVLAAEWSWGKWGGKKMKTTLQRFYR